MQESNAQSGDNQILINNGNAYQRITVVPADTNSSELSYVLIVQQPEDMKEGEQTDGDQDMTGKNDLNTNSIKNSIYINRF